MFLKESEFIEFKSRVVDEIKKAVIAFANTGGGSLYVGVEDNGNIIGIDDADKALLDINNMLRDGIKPDITLFVQCKTEQMADKNVIQLSIQRGTERPYYLAGKGIRPEGVYIRQGAASVPATDTAIRRMIRETDGDSYEKLRSTEQNLTFNIAKNEFSVRNILFGESQLTTLGLVNADRIYTNLALLLSDQCIHTIKVALFQDKTQQVFQDRHEFSSSLFKQINDVYDYMELNNKTAATFDRLRRIDRRDYPETALREALLNAIVHREYSTGGSILIKIFSDRIEFISPGGLVSGIELADIMSGYSVCRNANLAAVFYRLQLIEAYGTGIMKIFDAYKAAHIQPKIEVTPNVFKMTLPNLNVVAVEKKLTQEENILRFVHEHDSINRKQTEQLLGISQTSAGVILRKMAEQGELRREGYARNMRYVASDK